MYSKSVASDVTNDLCLRLLEKDNQIMNKLHSCNEFEKYTYRIIRNELINPRSICNKTYRSTEASMNDELESIEDEPDYNLRDLVSVLTPYELKLITIYSESPNICKLASKYKIRRATIYKEIKAIKLKIKQSLCTY